MRWTAETPLTTDLRTWRASTAISSGGLAASEVLVSLVTGRDPSRTGLYFGSAFVGLGAFLLFVIGLWRQLSRQTLNPEPLPPHTPVAIVRSAWALLAERWMSEVWSIVWGLIVPYLLLGPFFLAGMAGALVAGRFCEEAYYDAVKAFELRNSCELLLRVQPRERIWRSGIMYLRRLSP